MKRLLGFILVLFCTSTIFARGNFAAPAQDKPLSSIAEKTAGMEKMPGFFTYYWGARERA
jgi:hypothetical protein